MSSIKSTKIISKIWKIWRFIYKRLEQYFVFFSEKIFFIIYVLSVYSKSHKTVEFEDEISATVCVFGVAIKQIGLPVVKQSQ